MRYRSDVGDARHFEAGSLQRTDRRLASATGTGNMDVDLANAVLLGDARRFVRCDLRCERRAFAAALEVDIPGARPGDHVALRIGDRHDRVVERRLNMGDAHRNVLLLFCFALRYLLSCHVLLGAGPRGPTVLLLRLLLTGHGLLRTLALAGVASRALASGRQAAPMAQSAVGADFDETADIAVDFASKVALDLEVSVQDFAESADLGFSEIANLGARIDARLFQKLDDVMLADPVDQRQSVLSRLISGKVDTCDTCH